MSLLSAKMPSLKDKHAVEEASLKVELRAGEPSETEFGAVHAAGKRVKKESKKKVSKKDITN